jgi:hypothetical protein
MDLDKNRFLGSSLGVQSIPTFLFIHKGQVVKKMSGADKNSLINNIQWMVTSYNLIGGSKTVSAPPAPVQKTLQVYSEKSTPFFFDAEKWDLPIKKLKEFAVKHGYFEKPEYRDLEKSLVLQFGLADEEAKKLVVRYCIDAMPIDNVDDLVPFIDFVRICFLKPDLTE